MQPGPENLSPAERGQRSPLSARAPEAEYVRARHENMQASPEKPRARKPRPVTVSRNAKTDGYPYDPHSHSGRDSGSESPAARENRLSTNSPPNGVRAGSRCNTFPERTLRNPLFRMRPRNDKAPARISRPASARAGGPNRRPHWAEPPAVPIRSRCVKRRPQPGRFLSHTPDLRRRRHRNP